MASSQLEENAMETSMMSQSSAPGHDTGTLSMRKKAQLKRRITKEHNSNFRAGYVPVNEPYLYKAGIRGRKRFVLYCVFLALFVLAVLNTALTAWLLWIYRISHQGIEPIEFARSSVDQPLLRILDRAWFASLLLTGDRSSLGGRRNSDLLIEDDEGNGIVLSDSTSKNATTAEIGHNKIRLVVEDFSLWTTQGKQYLSLGQRPLTLPNPENLRNLQVDSLKASQINRNPKFDHLLVQSMINNVSVCGGRGVKVSSSEVMRIAGKSVRLKSTNYTVLNGAKGLYLSANLPVVGRNSTAPGSMSGSAYKLCVCGQNGRVFAVPAIPAAGLRCHTAGNITQLCNA